MIGATANQGFREWGRLFHDNADASAIADRHVEKGIVHDATHCGLGVHSFESPSDGQDAIPARRQA